MPRSLPVKRSPTAKPGSVKIQKAAHLSAGSGFFFDTGDVALTTDASGRKTASDHDALGHLLSVKRGPLDVNGLPTVTVLANSYSDPRTLLATSTIYPDGNTSLSTNYIYDASQLLAALHDPLGRITVFDYE